MPKISKIAALCKSSGCIYLMPKNDECQWIGNGYAIYPVYNFPELDKETVMTAFDIPEDKRDKMQVIQEMPATVSLLDDTAQDKAVGRIAPTIIINGIEHIPLYTFHGVLFIDSAFLAPIIGNDYELYERPCSSGLCIVAKLGFLIHAVIMPRKVIDRDFVGMMFDLARKCQTALEFLEAQNEQTEFENQLRIDPETGEVLEG